MQDFRDYQIARGRPFPVPALDFVRLLKAWRKDASCSSQVLKFLAPCELGCYYVKKVCEHIFVGVLACLGFESHIWRSGKTMSRYVEGKSLHTNLTQQSIQNSTYARGCYIPETQDGGILYILYGCRGKKGRVLNLWRGMTHTGMYSMGTGFLTDSRTERGDILMAAYISANLTLDASSHDMALIVSIP